MHLLNEHGLVMGCHGAMIRFQPHEQVGLMHPHRIVGDFRPAGLGDHGLHLREFQQRPLHRLGHLER